MSEESRKYRVDPETIFEKFKKKSSESGLNIDRIDETNRRLILSTGISLLSYGENIEVIVNREKDGGSQVYVNSKPIVWFNLTADGNNKRNVQRIFEIIDKEVE